MRFRLAIAIVTVLSICVFASKPAEAMNTDLTVSPLRQEIELAPGTALPGNLKVGNDSVGTQQLSFSSESFDVTNERYDYLFTTDTSESRWIRYAQESTELKAGQEVDVAYSVNVPIDAEPGGYYIALLITGRPTDSSGEGIVPTVRVASLLYVTVTGPATKDGRLVQLRSPSVSFGTAVWSATLQNAGTVHYRSNYVITVSTVTGSPIAHSEDTRLILPGSVRLIDGSVPNPEIIGIYKVTYDIGLGDSPGVIVERWMLYLPPLQTILILLIVASLLTLTIRRRKH
jgi:hypothetical protein